MAVTQVIASAEAVNEGEAYTTTLLADGHTLVADERKEVGGNALGPAPGDYLCAALASCKAITLRMYARRKNWTIGEVRVKVKLVKGDGAVSPTPNTFYCEIKLSAELDEEQKKRLLQISKVCPVDRLLGKQNEVVTILD
jgi:putative redox protein